MQAYSEMEGPPWLRGGQESLLRPRPGAFLRTVFGWSIVSEGEEFSQELNHLGLC